ncbi:MAG: CvpA family protein [Clostridia bacterium]|nr:CvpA family protein [Clostridia bacterium]
MNVIDIVILVIVGASVIYGLYRGFVQTVLSVACCLISIVVAFSYGPKLADLVSSKQGISSTLATYTDAVTRVGDYSLASTPVNQLSDGVIQQVLDSVNLPESIASILRGNLKNQTFEGTGLNTVNDYVSNTVVAVAVNILCFIVVYAACYLVLSILVSLIKHVFELPLLKQMDWLAGGIFGLARGALLLYVLFLLIPILSTIIPMEDFNDMLAQSTLAPIFQSDGFFAQVIAGKIQLF